MCCIWVQQKKELHKLQCIQNTAARLVLNLLSRASSKKALDSLHWLLIQKRISFKALCFCHRTLQGKGPIYLRDLLTPYNPERQLRSTGTHLVKVPRIKKAQMGACSFGTLAAKSWNALTLFLREEPSESLFRKKFKTWLFKL